jgi:hypothetical protein
MPSKINSPTEHKKTATYIAKLFKSKSVLARERNHGRCDSTKESVLDYAMFVGAIFRHKFAGFVRVLGLFFDGYDGI